MKTNNATLLITGAINVVGSIPFNTTLIDTKTRLEQYISSIEFAIKKYKTVERIIFVENTEYDFEYAELFELAAEFNKKLEILTFKGNLEEIVNKGKGFGEGEMIKYAYSNSKLMQHSSSFVKLTGRLRIDNFDNIIRNTDDNHNYFMLSFISKVRKNESIPTIFYKVNKEFYGTYLLDVYKNVNDCNKIKLENIFFNAVSFKSIKYFKYYPVIRGQSGSSGIQYNDVTQIELLKRKITFRLSSLIYSITS